MTLRQLLAKVATLTLSDPADLGMAVLEMEVKLEGCDCYGEADGVEIMGVEHSIDGKPYVLFTRKD